MRLILGIAAGLTIAWFMAGQQPSSHRKTQTTSNSQKQAVPTSLQVLLKPGQIYTLRFDKPLPVSGQNEKPPYREWAPFGVDFLKISPRAIRFRTPTLKEALERVKRNKEDYDRIEDTLALIREEYAIGAPFNMEYSWWSPPQPGPDGILVLQTVPPKSLVLISFSIETPRRKEAAQKVRVGKKGLEFKPVYNHTGARFFLIPETKNRELLVVPLH